MVNELFKRRWRHRGDGIDGECRIERIGKLLVQKQRLIERGGGWLISGGEFRCRVQIAPECAKLLDGETPLIAELGDR